MIHILELLLLSLIFYTVFSFHKKVSTIPEDRSIAFFSTIMVTIGIIFTIFAYLWASYSSNIDWSFIRPDWQQVNSKDWNDINYIEDKVGGMIFLLAVVTNPITALGYFYYGLGYAMSGPQQTINIYEVFGYFSIAFLLSIFVYLRMFNSIGRNLRDRKIKSKQMGEIEINQKSGTLFYYVVSLAALFLSVLIHYYFSLIIGDRRMFLFVVINVIIFIFFLKNKNHAYVKSKFYCLLILMPSILYLLGIFFVLLRIFI